jgi:hypothetical protein
MAPLTQDKTNAQKRIDSANADLKSFTAQKAKLQNAGSSSTTSNTPPASSHNSTTSNAPRGEKLKFSTDYKYNAPMVGSAYFGGDSFVNTVLEGKFVDQGKYGDAREAWKGTTGGRGTIQMDEKFLSTFTTNSQTSTKTKIDTQKYGFKFLYNPQTVSMSWGLMNYMSPPYEAMAQDPFQVVSAGLMTSVVTFDLVLNRIKDFDYLDGTGNITASPYPYPESPLDTADLKEIYQKGTMYDLEYLFKTINGPDGTFVSKLNGTTADKGWMRPTIADGPETDYYGASTTLNTNGPERGIPNANRHLSELEHEFGK